MTTVRRTLAEITKSKPDVDWDRIRKTSDKDIERMIAEDPDTAPVLTGRPARWTFNPPLPDIKAIRRKLKLSQSEFASRFGFSVRTVQQWEQKRTVPDRPARILLRVIEQTPEAVERALRATNPTGAPRRRQRRSA